MATEKGKTEHAGPKRGRGAWTTKADAKVSSRKRRRRADVESVTTTFETSHPTEAERRWPWLSDIE